MSINYQIHIQLAGSDPLIWRRITIPSDTPFDQFHDVIQITMGWKDEYAYQFRINGTTVRDFGTEIDTAESSDDRDALACTLSELVTMVHTKYTYLYGAWEHKLTLEKIIDLKGESQYAVCIGGERSCPPDDFPGIRAYQEMRNVLSDEKRPNYLRVTQRPGEVAAFDIDDINEQLTCYFEEWEEIYSDAQETIDRLENPDDDIDTDETVYQYSDYELLKDLKSPEDLFNDEVETEKMEDWIAEALEEEGSAEHRAFTRLVKEGHDTEQAESMIIKAISIEWFYDLKYGMTDYLDRYEYNLQHLPEEPKEILTLEWAIHILEHCTRGIPFKAIEYVHDDKSPEATAAIIKALREYSDQRCGWPDCASTAIWYSLAAEGHLCEDLIDPVIGLYGKDNPYETDWLHDQGQFLIGKLAQMYPDLTVQKVLAALERDAENKSDSLVYYLLDAFNFCDIGKYKERLIALLKRDDIYWHDILASTVAHLQIKEALPVLKEQLSLMESDTTERRTKVNWSIIDMKEAIERLETGIDLYPEVEIPVCLKRTTTWREEYADAEKYFYESGPLYLDNPDPGSYETFSASHAPFDLPIQQPIMRENKTGRNDPCPCGSGKKYKKCCLDKDLQEGRK